MDWEDRDEQRWIRLEGELDHEGCSAVEERFRRAASGGPGTVVVDLERVTFVTSDGLRLLLEARKHLRDAGRRILVAGLHEPARGIFETVGILGAIPEIDAEQ
jgi:anti-sigma B factor antagonist